MSKSFPVTALVIIGLCAATQTAAAACINPAKSRDYMKEKTLFDVGGSTFGASLEIMAGLRSAADLKALVSWLPGAADSIPSDYALVKADADGELRFFEKELTLLDLNAYAERSSGSYSKKFSIDVAGIDLYSGSNTLSGSMKDIGPFSAPFYTVVASYGIATAKGTISGEIGMRARGAASSSGLEVEGNMWAALVLEGTAGVSVGVAGVGLSGQVDLLEVDYDFNDKTSLSGGSYSFSNTYGASTLDGSLAVKASALGATKTLWDKSWDGHDISTTNFYSASGCVQ